MKTCYKCDTEKPLEEFPRDVSRKDYKSDYCKLCAREKTRKYRETQKIRKRELEDELKDYLDEITSSLSDNFKLGKYGISKEYYHDMLVRQKGVCAICKRKSSTGRALAMDYCHKTGKIRGLLCNKCNPALSLFSNDQEILMEAIRYLNNFNYKHLPKLEE